VPRTGSTTCTARSAKARRRSCFYSTSGEILDTWDPALIDALSIDRRVVTFDNVGVGGSSGITPSTVAQMATDAIAFLDAMEFARVDVLGFSIGSFVAQELALIRPSALRRLILASSAPQGAAGMHWWAPAVIEAVGGHAPNPDGYLGVFFTHSAASRQSGMETLGRLTTRTDDRDRPTTWCARGEFPITACCNGSARSICPCLSRTAIATR
jgi:pimeloyl-ACP methyl ester carboxylesterase